MAAFVQRSEYVPFGTLFTRIQSGRYEPTGRIVEDERIFGCMEFGIGSQGKMIRGSYWTAASHTDGVVSKPTIIVDGVTIEENGKYVDPQLAEICKQMGVEGY